MMQNCILKWDYGKCVIKTPFFLPLLPARFLLGPPEDGTGPKPGAAPPDTRPPSTPDHNPPNRIPETPGGDRGRPRHREPDHGHDRDRDRRRGRTPENERRNYRPGGLPEEDEEEEEPDNNETVEDRLRRLLGQWEHDLERLREKLKADLYSL
ncbi:E4 [Bos taurus papillomavirus 23]|uniref:E4 n=1 Tax=Bos taurus papillomavirus 23 TaxID=2758958 RepID=A0A1L6KTE4_9PAPI|nr:E4 [Bos taurus papillomavirus 23]